MKRSRFLKIGAGAITSVVGVHIWRQESQSQQQALAQGILTNPREFNNRDRRDQTDQQCLTLWWGQMDRLLGNGIASEVQLLRLLRLNSAPLNIYGDLPYIYREESAIEGINHDIAFCQMCLETGFLQFDGDVRPEQNNFAGIGATGNGVRGDSFVDRRTGVRAQIQHLKAYATTSPLVQPLVDPRFDLVKRGSAPLLGQLSGKWAEDINYDKKIMAILRRLYGLLGLM
ncbi:MAG: glucosaminidase domain-containing protein [Pseudanabaenaceae cyanobacterium bins.39]|nr:glucosaminidase domain-containing protein [Pseudanabaenaceae cyanobacterium bins.39]